MQLKLPVIWRLAGVVIGHAETERGALNHAARAIHGRLPRERFTARLADTGPEGFADLPPDTPAWFVGVQLR